MRSYFTTSDIRSCPFREQANSFVGRIESIAFWRGCVVSGASISPIAENMFYFDVISRSDQWAGSDNKVKNAMQVQLRDASWYWNGNDDSADCGNVGHKSATSATSRCYDHYVKRVSYCAVGVPLRRGRPTLICFSRNNTKYIWAYVFIVAQ